MKQGIKLKKQESDQQIGLFRLLKHTPPVFSIFIHGLLLVLMFIALPLVADEMSFAEQCNKEVTMEELNIPLIKNVCLHSAKQREKNNDYGGAAWHYLLAGDLDHLLKEMPRHIDPETSTVIYVNIGHAYVLRGGTDNAEYFYKTFITKEEIYFTNKATQNDYRLLQRLYPVEKKKLKQGLALWNKLFKPYKAIESLYRKVEKLNNTISIVEKLDEISQRLQELELISIGETEENHLNLNKQFINNLLVKYFNETESIDSSLLNYFSTPDKLLLLRNIYKQVNPETDVLIYLNLSNIYTLLGDKENTQKLYNQFINIVSIRELFGAIGTQSSNLPEYAGLKNIWSEVQERNKYITLVWADKKVNESLIYLEKLFPNKKTIINDSKNLWISKINDLSILLLHDLKKNTQQKGETKHDITSALLEKLEPLINSGDSLRLLKFLLNIEKNKKFNFDLSQNLNTTNIVNNAKNKIREVNLYINNSITYNKKGDYKKAIVELLKVMMIVESIDKNSQDVAATALMIGGNYYDLTDYQSALKYFKQALITFEKIPDNKQNLESCYNHLGTTYLQLGEPLKALNYLKKQIKSLETNNAYSDTREIGNAYLNIANIYLSIGDYTQAISFSKKALENKKKFFEKSPEIANVFNTLSVIYTSKKDTKAIKYAKKAVNFYKNYYGKNHYKTAFSYNNLAHAYYQVTKDSEKALEFSLKALHIYESIGKESPESALNYDNVGLYYSDIKEYEKALIYQKKALSLFVSLHGENHRDVIISKNNLGRTYLLLEDYEKSYQFSKEAFDLYINQRSIVFNGLGSEEKKYYLTANKEKISWLLVSFSTYINNLLENKHKDKASNLVTTMIDDWISYKGSTLENENRLIQLVRISNNKLLQQSYQQLINVKKEYANYYQSYPNTTEERAIWTNKLKEIKNKIMLKEQEVKKLEPRFIEEKIIQTIKSQDIAKALDKNSTYIDFAKTVNGYYFFIIDNNNIAFNAYSDKDSKAIDAQIKLFQKDIEAIVSKKSLASDLTELSKQSLGKLYKLIFTKELLKKTANKKSLIISPDGALRLLPFEALYDAEKQGGGQYLIESIDIRYIASGKELVRLARQNKGKTNANKAVLFANPDFGGKPSKETQETRSTVYTPNTDASKTMGTLSLSPNFKALAGTKDEADAIAKVLTLKEILHDYRGNDANEANLLEVKSPSILHIATHGFFLKDIPNPMLKSGLILAGANKSLKANKGDGIVTALDLSGLELQGTDLVVLSACETGKVDPNNTDGISGLTKAFIQAGAKNVVMSLWSVADKETADLMTAFYKAGKEDKQYAKALKKSKLALLDKGMHPYYWAAFVLSGGN